MDDFSLVDNGSIGFVDSTVNEAKEFAASDEFKTKISRLKDLLNESTRRASDSVMPDDEFEASIKRLEKASGETVDRSIMKNEPSYFKDAQFIQEGDFKTPDFTDTDYIELCDQIFPLLDGKVYEADEPFYTICVDYEGMIFTEVNGLGSFYRTYLKQQA